MMKKGVFVLSLFLAIGVSAQKTITEEFEDCFFNAFPDKGVSVKKFVKEFESKLIETKALKNSSKEGYYELFQKMSNGEYIQPIANYSFFDSIQTLSYFDKLLQDNTKCIQQMEKRADYRTSVLFKMKKRQDSVEALNINRLQKNRLALAVMTEDFFANKVARLKMLMLVEMNMISPVPPPPNIEIVEVEEAAFEIILNAKNEIEVVTKTYGENNLSESLERYLKEKKESAVIQIASSRSATYGKYKELVKVIEDTYRKVRKEYALEAFQKEYDRLDTSLKEKVDERYPLKTKMKVLRDE